MAKYLTKFTDQAAYEAGEKQYPNVSLLDNGEVKYMAVKPPYQGKALLTYNDGTEYEIVCNTSSTLTQAEVRGRSGYDKTDITQAEIGTCTTSIDVRAFFQCRSLSNVIIPSGVTIINNNSFNDCRGLTDVNFRDNSQLTTIERQGFYNCTSLTSFTIPNGVTGIGNSAFTNCHDLITIIIPSGVTTLNDNLFYGCNNLTSVTFAEGSQLSSIEKMAFYSCSGLTSINIPSGVISIGDYALCQCHSFASVDFPNSITTIGAAVCYNCSGLTSVNIPSGVTSIGNNAFGNCGLLTSVTCYATTPPTLGDNVFRYSNNAVIYVPAESVSAYRQAPNWSNWASRIQAIQ